MSLNYGRHWLDDSDIAAVVEVLKGEWLTIGPKVRQFEEDIAAFTGAKFAVAVNNGTSALKAAYHAANVAGYTVVTTPLTFAATANMAIAQGARVCFRDVGDDWNMNPKFTWVPHKVITPVDFAGLPCDYDAIKDNAWIVIQDACHSLGATYKGRPVGSYADMTCFSFFPTKAIATGEGGAITTNNSDYYEALKQFRDHGRKDGVVVEIGENLRIPDILCALGITQLKKLPMFIERRQEIAYKYCEAFRMKFYENHAYHLFVVMVTNPQEAKARLAEKGIIGQIHYRPLHLHPYYGGKVGDCPVAEKYYKHCLTIPLFPKMTNEDVELVIEEVKPWLDAKSV